MINTFLKLSRLLSSLFLLRTFPAFFSQSFFRGFTIFLLLFLLLFWCFQTLLSFLFFSLFLCRILLSFVGFEASAINAATSMPNGLPWLRRWGGMLRFNKIAWKVLRNKYFVTSIARRVLLHEYYLTSTKYPLKTPLAAEEKRSYNDRETPKCCVDPTDMIIWGQEQTLRTSSFPRFYLN